MGTDDGKWEINRCNALRWLPCWFHAGDNAFIALKSAASSNTISPIAVCTAEVQNEDGSLLTLHIKFTFLIKPQRLAGFMTACQENYLHPVDTETFTCPWNWWCWGLWGQSSAGHHCPMITLNFSHACFYGFNNANETQLIELCASSWEPGEVLPQCLMFF